MLKQQKMADVFHVEFGMNETPLTTALENQDWDTAEHIILNTNDVAYLNEGAYDKIPLNMLLWTTEDYEIQRILHKSLTLNLYLVRLLIERGADVNKTCPVIGNMYYRSLTVVQHLCYLLPRVRNHKQGLCWHQVIGLQKVKLNTRDDIYAELFLLLEMVIGVGGNVNVADLRTDKNSPLHTVLSLRYSDCDVIKCLCDAGANVNAKNGNGYTPLAFMCRWILFYPERYDENEVLERIRTTTEQPSFSVKEFSHSTAMFDLLAGGFVKCIKFLLDIGADTSSSTYVTLVSPHHELSDRVYHVPSLLAYFFWEGIRSREGIQSLVDSGHFDDKVGLDILKILINCNPIYKELSPKNLVQLMFGKISAGLKQHCIRKLCTLVPDKYSLQKVWESIPIDLISSFYVEHAYYDIRDNIRIDRECFTDASDNDDSTTDSDISDDSLPPSEIDSDSDSDTSDDTVSDVEDHEDRDLALAVIAVLDNDS